MNEFPTWSRGSLRATAALILLISSTWPSPSLAQTALPATRAGANPKLLTLPFNDPSVRISQGWICHWGADECTKLYEALIHGGIDYVKGTWPGDSGSAKGRGIPCTLRCAWAIGAPSAKHLTRIGR